MTSPEKVPLWVLIVIAISITVVVPYLVNQIPPIRSLIARAARSASVVTRWSEKTCKTAAYAMLITATAAIVLIVTRVNAPNASEHTADSAASSASQSTAPPRETSMQTSVNSPVIYPVDSKIYLPPPVPGLVIQKGQTVHVSQKNGGDAWNCAVDETSPSGIEGVRQRDAGDSPMFVVPGENLCILIAKIGDGPWKSIGPNRAITAETFGPLTFMVNEMPPDKCKYPAPPPPPNPTCYTDNDGTIVIAISVTP